MLALLFLSNLCSFMSQLTIAPDLDMPKKLPADAAMPDTAPPRTDLPLKPDEESHEAGPGA